VKAGFAGTEVLFGESLSVECEPGYEPKVGTAKCEAKTTADESEVELTYTSGTELSCQPMECADVVIADGTAACGGKTFGETCDVTCADGFMPDTGSPTITCDVEPTGDGKPGWTLLKCIPTTCDSTALPDVAGSAGTAGTCEGTLGLGDTCTVPCAAGKGGNVDGTSVLVECTAGTTVGVLTASAACADIVCTDSKVASCADSSDGCGPTGGPYEYACGAGNVVAGTASAKTDVECTYSGAFKVALTSGGFADVSCVASGSTATAVTKTVVTTTFKVSAADRDKMCDNMPALATSMQTTICGQNALTACPDVTAESDDCDSGRRARRLSDAVLFAVDFAVATDSMSADEQAGLTTVLTALSEDESLQATLKAEIQKEVPGVAVLGMEVSEPKTVVEYTVTPPSSDSGGDGDEGGSPILIIVGLLLVVALGFGAWKMKQGSS
jgi:hypothetical protein